MLVVPPTSQRFCRGKASVQLREIIELGDENASFAAHQNSVNDIAENLEHF